MNIAFDISPLLTASGTFGDKSGVYRYTLGLLKSYVEYLKKSKSKRKIVLFSYNLDLLRYPINPEIIDIMTDESIVVLNPISRIKQEPILDSIIYDLPQIIRIVGKFISSLFQLRIVYFDLQQRIKFRSYIDYLAKQFKKNKVRLVFHSDTGFYPFSDFINLITIYDLTAIQFDEYHRHETADLQKRKIRFAKKYCNKIITISQSTKKDLINYSRAFKNKKIEVLYPGLDSIFNKSRNIDSNKTLFSVNKILNSQNSKAVEKKYLLYYSTFEPRKNIHYLVKAFSDLQLEKKVPSDFKLILIGGDGWGRVKKNIKAYLAENYPIISNKNVIIVDYVSDRYLIDFIKNAYAMIYPSLYEGFGLPVLESMAMGIPVICSNTSSLPEVGGDSVLYVNPHIYKDLKNKIEYLINNTGFAKKIAKKGLAQSKKFNWNETAIKFHKFIKSS